MTQHGRCGWFVMSVFSLVVSRAMSGEAILSENFDALDLTQLPDGFTLTNGAEISLVEDPVKGKVLRINHEKEGGEAGLIIALDAAKVRGNNVHVTVAIKCPKSYTPVKEKNGYPQLMIMFRDATGSGRGSISAARTGFAEWHNLKTTYAVPQDAASVIVAVRVLEVVADVYFDSLHIEMTPGVAQPGAPGAPNAPAPQNTNPFDNAADKSKSGTPAPADKNSGPSKMLADDGIIYNAAIGAEAKARRKSGAVTGTLTLVGSGLPNPELETKAPPRWKWVPAAKEVSGIPPEKLSAMLPAFLVKNKPEIVVIAGDSKPGRKLSQDEAGEWADLARICARFGAVPVLAISADENDELRKEMLLGAESARCVVLELRPPLDKRLRTVVELIEKNILERDIPAEQAKLEDE